MTVYAPPCRLLRRFGAIVYDTMLLAAVIMVATLPVLMLHGGATDGDAWFRGYVLAIGYAYFGWFWTHGGQTLGMRAWRVIIIHEDGGPPGWRACGIRYLTAVVAWIPLAGGFFWSLIDREKRTLHDIASRTSLVVLPRRRPSDDPSQDHDPGHGEQDNGSQRGHRNRQAIDDRHMGEKLGHQVVADTDQAADEYALAGAGGPQ